MKKLANWFYGTQLYYKFRYYFIRKKAPLSWIFWGDILKRRSMWTGSYEVSLATVGEPDASLSFGMGSPKDNKIEINVFDGEGKIVQTVNIPLSYHSMQKIDKAFNSAVGIIRQRIREDNAELENS